MNETEETSESMSFSKGLYLKETNEVVLDLKCQARADRLCSVGSGEPWKVLEPERELSVQRGLGSHLMPQATSPGSLPVLASL